MPEASYYPPGYIKKFRINEVAGMHGAMSGECKPWRVIARDQCFAYIDANRTDPDKFNRYMAVHVAESLVSWDIVDKGIPLPITPANLLDLPPTQFDKLYRIVNGTYPSEPDMSAKPGENSEWMAAADASINGAFADQQEAAATKNSLPG